MTKRILRYSGLGLAVFAAGAIVACSSSDEPIGPTAGASAGGAKTAGAGGASAGTPSVAGGGTTASAGTAGAAAGSAGFACVGTKPTSALITEFADLVAHPTQMGDYAFTLGVPGGTYTYQAKKLTLSNAGMMLNVKGTVDNYYGFGLYFNTCTDASAYTGVTFTIKGNAGPTGKIGFRIQTNSNMAVNADAMKGTCVVPPGTTNTYELCHDGEVEVPVTAEGSVVSVKFSDIMLGIPVDGVTAKELVGLEWAFRWTEPPVGTAGAGGGGAAGGSGGGAGSSGGGAGGSSAGAGGSSAGAGGSSAGAGGSRAGAGGSSAGAGGSSAGAGGAATAGSAGSATAGAGGGASTPSNYAADITIDNVQFIGGPPAGGAGGAAGAGASAGGASGGSVGGASGGSVGGASGGSAGGASGGSAAGAGGASAGAGGAKGGSAGTGG